MIHVERGRAPALHAAICTCLWLLCSSAWAQSPPGPVGIVRDDDRDPRISEVRTRIAAELVAAGLPWAFVESTQDLTRTPAGRPWALVFVAGSAQGIAVEIALPGRDGAGVDARRLIPIGASSALTPTELALRAVEVLRAHVAAGPVTRPSADPSQAHAALPPPVPSPNRILVQAELGASALRGTKDLGIGLGPAGAITLSRGGLGVRAAAASSLWLSRAQGADVGASVSQWLFTAELLMLFRSNAVRVRPFVCVGAGALRLQADAAQDDRLIATHASRWAFASKIGVGAQVALGARVHLLAELGLVVTEPALAVQVAGPGAGVAGRPTQVVRAAFAWSL